MLYDPLNQKSRFEPFFSYSGGILKKTFFSRKCFQVKIVFRAEIIGKKMIFWSKITTSKSELLVGLIFGIDKLRST